MRGFCTALLAVGLACLIPKLLHKNSILMLVLAGIVVSGFMSAILGLMKFLADPDGQLADIVFWTMGSLNGVVKLLEDKMAKYEQADKAAAAVADNIEQAQWSEV